MRCASAREGTLTAVRGPPRCACSRSRASLSKQAPTRPGPGLPESGRPGAGDYALVTSKLCKKSLRLGHSLSMSRDPVLARKLSPARVRANGLRARLTRLTRGSDDFDQFVEFVALPAREVHQVACALKHGAVRWHRGDGDSAAAPEFQKSLVA